MNATAAEPITAESLAAESLAAEHIETLLARVYGAGTLTADDRAAVDTAFSALLEAGTVCLQAIKTIGYTTAYNVACSDVLFDVVEYAQASNRKLKQAVGAQALQLQATGAQSPQEHSTR